MKISEVELDLTRPECEGLCNRLNQVLGRTSTGLSARDIALALSCYRTSSRSRAVPKGSKLMEVFGDTAPEAQQETNELAKHIVQVLKSYEEGEENDPDDGDKVRIKTTEGGQAAYLYWGHAGRWRIS